MALTKNDLQQLKEVVSTEITNQLSTQLVAQDARFSAALHQQKSELVNAFDQQTQDIKRDIRDEMNARFGAFENKMNGKFEGLRIEFRQEIKAVIDILLTFVPERFEALERDVVRLKVHIKLA